MEGDIIEQVSSPLRRRRVNCLEDVDGWLNRLAKFVVDQFPPTAPETTSTAAEVTLIHRPRMIGVIPFLQAAS
jgi:hypothetical protein